MAPDELARNVAYLMDRQAIRDIMSTYARGVDRFDEEALLSVYHEDAIDDHGSFIGNREAFRDWVFAMHGEHHLSTQHSVTNHLAEIVGDTAYSETYYQWSAMNKRGAPFIMVGGRYVDQLEKRDGEWRIFRRKCLVDWIAPSINSLAASGTAEGRANFSFLKKYQADAAKRGPRSVRGKADPIYERPLVVPEDRLADWKRLLEEGAGGEAVLDFEGVR